MAERSLSDQCFTLTAVLLMITVGNVLGLYRLVTLDWAHGKVVYHGIIGGLKLRTMPRCPQFE